MCDGLPFHARFFLIVPFMHQEEMAAQEEGVTLFEQEVERAKVTKPRWLGQLRCLGRLIREIEAFKHQVELAVQEEGVALFEKEVERTKMNRVGAVEVVQAVEAFGTVAG